MPFLPVLVPLISLVFLFLISYRQTQCWRRATLAAAIAWGVILVALTELLSLFALVNSAWLLRGWSLSGAILAFLYVRRLRHDRPRLPKVALPQPFQMVSLLSLVLIVAVTGVVALVAAPNNWDSMTYHMSRVVNWIHHQSVAHYPTHNLRQLDLPPGSSFFMMHLQILSGGDRFANLVQWSSLVGSLVGISLVARQLGANPVGQMLASVVCATIPMGILQASSTQNDYVVAFWLVCLSYYSLAAAQAPVRTGGAIAVGASLGLAILTKATAYVYGFPFFLLWGISLAVPLGFRFFYKSGKDFWRPFVWGIVPILLLNAPHWWRNTRLVKSPLGISGDVAKNQLFTLPALASNAIRNIGLHLAIPHQGINDLAEGLIRALHLPLGLAIDDPRTTFLQAQFQIPITPKFQPILLSEDASGNPIHLLLIAACILAYVLHKPLQTRLRTVYLLSLMAGFLLFNLVLAWQPWATRLHLPLFVLASALVGTVVSETFRQRLVHYLLVLVLAIAAIPYLMFNTLRPLGHHPQFMTFSYSILSQARQDIYFNSRPPLGEAYREAIARIQDKNCSQVGLYIGGDSWEYPIWSLLQAAASADTKTQVKSVMVSNPSGSIPPESFPANQFTPCAVLAVERPELKRRIVLRQGDVTGKKAVYRRAWKGEAVSVYFRRK